MDRRGRIPVATYRTPEGKTRSRSRVRDPNYNKSDPDTDLFTLLEDNIALREENGELIIKNTTFEEDKRKMEKENSELKTRIKELIGQHESLKSQIIEINLTLNKTIEEKMVMKSSQQQQADKIKRITKQLDELKASKTSQPDYSEIIETNKMLKEEICKLLPATNTNEFESLVENHKDTSHLIAIECIQKLISEFTQLKTNLNNAELHLYEANEKISELLENQTHLEDEIEHLRVENTKLTRVAELMTTNMKESVNTSKKMEEALIEMKRRNDELAKRNLDSLDGGGVVGGGGRVGDSPIPIVANEEIVRLRDEISRRDLAHGERIVEMKELMDQSIANNSNDEIKLLRLKLEMIEKELKDACERAERAESKLRDYETNSSKNGSQIKLNGGGSNGICDECYQSSSSLNRLETSVTASTPAVLLAAPPPPPPPMPKINFPSPVASMKNSKGARSLNDSITSHNLKPDGSNLMRKQQVESTGLDALVKELKDGNVTLRRARRRTQTNAALKELFDVLEVSRTQNRNSKILIKNHMTQINLTLSEF